MTSEILIAYKNHQNSGISTCDMDQLAQSKKNGPRQKTKAGRHSRRSSRKDLWPPGVGDDAQAQGEEGGKDGDHDELDLEVGHKVQPHDGPDEQRDRHQRADDVGPSREGLFAEAGDFARVVGRGDALCSASLIGRSRARQ